MVATALYNYKRYLDGDKSALDELVRTLSDSITRYAYCYLNDAATAEDVMEETFATLIVKRRHFKDDQHLCAYLYRVARNKSIDYLRWRGKQIPLEDVEEILSHNELEASVMAQERNRLIYTCMQQLPRQYREILYLNYFDGFTIVEICHILNKNTKQVYNLLSRAKAALKEIFLKEGITYEDL